MNACGSRIQIWQVKQEYRRSRGLMAQEIFNSFPMYTSDPSIRNPVFLSQVEFAEYFIARVVFQHCISHMSLYQYSFFPQ
jgi:hypothetical protein